MREDRGYNGGEEGVRCDGSAMFLSHDIEYVCIAAILISDIHNLTHMHNGSTTCVGSPHLLHGSPCSLQVVHLTTN